MQILFQIVQNEPIPPHEVKPDISQALSDIVLTMIAKRPEDRFQTMREVYDALKGASNT